MNLWGKDDSRKKKDSFLRKSDLQLNDQMGVTKPFCSVLILQDLAL